MLLMQTMEDSSRRLIYDCRLAIGEVLLPLWRLTNVLFKVRNGALPLEMLKMKIDPAMCVKTQETMTKCPAKNRAFTRKCTICARINRNPSGLLPEDA